MLLTNHWLRRMLDSIIYVVRIVVLVQMIIASYFFLCWFMDAFV